MDLVVADSVARFARILGIDRENADIKSRAIPADNTVQDFNALFARNRDCDGGHGSYVIVPRRPASRTGRQNAMSSAIESDK